ncbi:MAG: PorT family protein [Williamsia sp.]|nr:PorT family protein [Williamsia sp.]
MKLKSLTFLVALFATVTTAYSQQRLPFFELGIKGGTNITKVDGVSFKDEFKYGYNLGAFAALRVGEKWQVQPEVLFNQYVSKTADNFDQLNPFAHGNNLRNVHLNYVSIPLLLAYSPTRFFTFQAGPQYGILIDKNVNLVQNGKNAFKDGDFSMLGGVQLNIANFKLIGRYVVGLNNINDIDNKEKWKNQGFQLSLGLRIL